MTHDKSNNTHTTPNRTDQTMTNAASNNRPERPPKKLSEQEQASFAAFEAAIAAHAKATQRTALPVGVSARLQAITLMPQMLSEDEALHGTLHSGRQRSHHTALEDALAFEMANAGYSTSQEAVTLAHSMQPEARQFAAKKARAEANAAMPLGPIQPASVQPASRQPIRPDIASQLFALTARLLPGPSLWQFAGQGAMAAAVFMVGFSLSAPELGISQPARVVGAAAGISSAQDDERFDLSAFYLEDFSDPQADSDTAGYAALFEEE